MTEELGRSSLELPASLDFLEPAAMFIAKYMSQLGMEEDRMTPLLEASRRAMTLVIKNNSQNPLESNRVGIDVFSDDGRGYVEVLNRGVPIFIDHDQFGETATALDQFSVENLGRQGQTVVLGMGLGEKAHRKSYNDVGKRTNLLSEADLEKTQIRRLLPGEAKSLSELFYYVYGYNYIQDFVYYPEKIEAMLRESKLISTVAVAPDGRLLGHVGLMKWGENPDVYEPCLGVSHPLVKSKGFFSRIFQKTMELVDEIPMQYAFFDFVTNHAFSQKMVSRYKPAILALFVGCQSKQTQARLERLGIGLDPKETDRYSLLYGVIPKVEFPFGKEIALPNSIGEVLGFLLEPLNLRWYPTSRFDLLPDEGEFETKLQPTQNAVIFDLFRPGRDSVNRILVEWEQLLKVGYQYAAVEVPVGAQGLGNLQDILADRGFFVAGFIPYHYSDGLGFRFQTIGPTKLDFTEISAYEETSKKLLEIVRDNYERNQIL